MEEKLLSLFEYLGKPAGTKLGNEVKMVWIKTTGKPVKVQQIENPKYKGPVCIYPESFLENYFNPIPDSFDRYSKLDKAITKLLTGNLTKNSPPGLLLKEWVDLKNNI